MALNTREEDRWYATGLAMRQPLGYPVPLEVREADIELNIDSSPSTLLFTMDDLLFISNVGGAWFTYDLDSMKVNQVYDFENTTIFGILNQYYVTVQGIPLFFTNNSYLDNAGTSDLVMYDKVNANFKVIYATTDIAWMPLCDYEGSTYMLGRGFATGYINRTCRIDVNNQQVIVYDGYYMPVGKLSDGTDLWVLMDKDMTTPADSGGVVYKRTGDTFTLVYTPTSIGQFRFYRINDVAYFVYTYGIFKYNPATQQLEQINTTVISNECLMLVFSNSTIAAVPANITTTKVFILQDGLFNKVYDIPAFVAGNVIYTPYANADLTAFIDKYDNLFICARDTSYVWHIYLYKIGTAEFSTIFNSSSLNLGCYDSWHEEPEGLFINKLKMDSVAMTYENALLRYDYNTGVLDAWPGGMFNDWPIARFGGVLFMEINGGVYKWNATTGMMEFLSTGSIGNAVIGNTIYISTTPKWYTYNKVSKVEKYMHAFSSVPLNNSISANDILLFDIRTLHLGPLCRHKLAKYKYTGYWYRSTNFEAHTSVLGTNIQSWWYISSSTSDWREVYTDWLPAYDIRTQYHCKGGPLLWQH